MRIAATIYANPFRDLPAAEVAALEREHGPGWDDDLDFAITAPPGLNLYFLNPGACGIRECQVDDSTSVYLFHHA